MNFDGGFGCRPGSESHSGQVNVDSQFLLAVTDTEKAVEFILSCMIFDGGFGCRPRSESHSRQVNAVDLHFVRDTFDIDKVFGFIELSEGFDESVSAQFSKSTEVVEARRAKREGGRHGLRSRAIRARLRRPCAWKRQGV